MRRRTYTISTRDANGAYVALSRSYSRRREAILRRARQIIGARVEVWSSYDTMVGRVATGSAHELVYSRGES